MQRLTTWQKNAIGDLAANMARKIPGRSREFSKAALRLATELGVDRFMSVVMDQIERNNLNVAAPSCGCRFLCSGTETGIPPELQRLLSIIYERVVRSHGRRAFYPEVRTHVDPSRFLRAFLFRPADQQTAREKGFITDDDLNKIHMRHLIKRARDRSIEIADISNVDDEDGEEIEQVEDAEDDDEPIDDDEEAEKDKDEEDADKDEDDEERRPRRGPNPAPKKRPRAQPLYGSEEF